MGETAEADGGTTSQQQPKSMGKKILEFFLNDLLLYLTILAVLMGALVGFILRTYEPEPYTIYVLKFPGEIMLRMLKMLILPLITCSLISGVTALDSEASGKMGSKALLYYFSTTIMATILGLIMVIVIHPGDPKANPKDQFTEKPDAFKGNTIDALFDLVRNMFPDNLVQACFQQARTSFKAVEVNDSKTGEVTTVYQQSGVEYANGMNVLGLITFCICIGVVMTKMKEVSQPLITLISALNDMIMKLVLFFMWYSPVGIFFLIVSNILTIKDLASTGKVMGMFIFTVIAGLSVHFCVTLVGLYFAFTRKNPLVFIRNMLPAMMTAFGTASSTATLPLTFHCLEEKNKIDARVTRFVIPIGATVNMDGTALYEALTAIFIAQLNDIDMNLGNMLTICITSIAASVGAASIPSAGLVTMILVFTAVGLPTEQISLIYTIDWFLDRFRTMINVMGDSFGAAIVYEMSKAELEGTEPKDNKVDFPKLPIQAEENIADEQV
ncbi:excitatory amino acid transporter-like [Symsagittifera roscoffensis]|uniref:excitatory amino acid transporter-like n=1 Tax=Symsagittifera roscoffensis TaxID=84072 RepID=UPI00307C916F